MFFKKKKTDLGAGFEVDFDPGPRMYFRVTPSLDEPIEFEAGGVTWRVLDIGAGGFRFMAEGGRFKPGDVFSTEFSLPLVGERVQVTVRVVEADRRGEVRVEMMEYSEDGQEYLHQYVLERQKEELAQRRG